MVSVSPFAQVFVQFVRIAYEPDQRFSWISIFQKDYRADAPVIIRFSVTIPKLLADWATIGDLGRTVQFGHMNKSCLTQGENDMKFVTAAVTAASLVFGATSAIAACDDGEIVISSAT